MAPPAVAGIDRATALIAGLVALVLVAGYVVLAALGRPTDTYALFVSGPIVSTIVGAVLARRVGAVQAVAEDVRHATNGLLSHRLDQLDEGMAAASAERQDLAAAAGPTPEVPPAAGPVAGPSSREQLAPRHRTDEAVDL